MTMTGIRPRLIGLCLVPLLFCALDGTVTLVGQSSRYWEGNYRDVNEASPTFNHLLHAHPVAFLLGSAVWLLTFVGIILLLPDTLALIVSIAVTFGHAAGAATWFLYQFQFGYQVCNGLFLLAAILLGVAIRHGWQAKPAEYSPPVRNPILRWGVVIGLFAFGIYLFVWPRSA
jgi:hypothetical protein